MLIGEMSDGSVGIGSSVLKKLTFEMGLHYGIWPSLPRSELPATTPPFDDFLWTGSIAVQAAAVMETSHGSACAIEAKVLAGQGIISCRNWDRHPGG